MDFIDSGPYQENSQPPPPEVPIVRPTGTIFTFFITFKAVPIFTYMFSWIICPLTVMQWVLTIVSAAVDFWFTKNVAGRLILGMRWSNRVNEVGESTWLFEFVQNLPEDRSGQRRTFWTLLYANTAVWGLFSFFSLIRLNFGWLFVTIINLTLAASNTWGFMKCDRSIKSDVQKEANDLFTQKILPFLVSNAMSNGQSQGMNIL